jgi:predicted DNA-binding WGR domain protein
MIQNSDESEDLHKFAKMKDEIKDFIESKSGTYVQIPIGSIKKIHNLYFSGKITDVIHPMEMLYFGLYFDYQKDHDTMKKYYLMAIKNDNIYAMGNFGNYYKKQKDYDNMKKYYLIAIKKGYSYSMKNLGNYYEEQKDYDNMKKYYFMAIEKGNSHAMNELAIHYKKLEDYGALIKLYYDNLDKYGIIDKLVDELSKLLNKKKDEISVDYSKIIDIIININLDDVSNVPMHMILLKKSLMESVDLYDLHFKYTPDGIGYEQAKQDFKNRVGTA